MALEHRLAPCGVWFFWAIPLGQCWAGWYPSGCIDARGQGSRAGAHLLGTISNQGCESLETSLQACRANCCLLGVSQCRNPELHGAGGPKVCQRGTTCLFSMAPDTSHFGCPGGSLGKRDAALHCGGSVCWVFGAGWHLQPGRSRLARGLAAPTAAPLSLLPLFPTPSVPRTRSLPRQPE